jgi:hypothetical protein
MKWKQPSPIKIYEALGTLGDNRIEIEGNTAKVYSSSRGKFYTVTYNPAAQEIMSNDNAAYWQGTLGYPAIAFLLKQNILSYNPTYADALKGIAWKDINTQFKNNFEKTVAYVHDLVAKKGIDVEQLQNEIATISSQIEALALSYHGTKTKPPEGY